MPPKKKSSSVDNVLHIGIDLGTSRSVVSASNGKREWVHSFVGWPKDFVSRKMLGKSILFGQDAIDNRLSLNVVRPLEYGVIREGTARDEEAVRELVHHLIEMAQPEDGKEIFAAVGVPGEALKVNKLAIREAVKEYADALMVVSEPFSVAYGLGALNNAMIIDIGAGTTDFCVMHGTMPGEEDQRTLTQAGDYIDEQLIRMLQEKFPTTKFSENLVRSFKEQYGFVGPVNGRVKVRVPVEGRFTEHDITDEMKAACERILPSIVETTIDLVSRYDPEFQELVAKNIYLAGGGSQIKGVAEELEQKLREYGNYRVTRVDDPLYGGADGALALAQDMPEEYWENM